MLPTFALGNLVPIASPAVPASSVPLSLLSVAASVPLPPSPVVTTPSHPTTSPLETAGAEATPSGSRKRAPSTGASHYPEGPGAAQGIAQPAPLLSPSLPPSSAPRRHDLTAQYELLSSSVFALPEIPVLSYAEAVTDAQLREYDAEAEWQYQCLLDDMLHQIGSAKTQRMKEGDMDWIAGDEEWFLCEVTEIAMDPRR